MNNQGVLMNKSVLLSVRPQYCKLIANGQKTIEVRKTRPKLETPFKCYIYCTHDKEHTLFKDWIDPPFVTKEYNIMNGKGIKNVFHDNRPWGNANGKVIGEFVCDSYIGWGVNPLDGLYMIFPNELAATCLTGKDFEKYGNGKTLYGWHISALQIYDKPRELSECHKPVMPMGLRYEEDAITRAPQSWCYVEELEEPCKTKN